MEPIPETLEAIEELGPYAAEGDLLDLLLDKGRRVQDLVPDCLGMSLVSIDHGVTFTLVASASELAGLAAVDRLTGAPDGEGPPALPTHIASSLFLPILSAGRVRDQVELYAASPEAFAGGHEQLAAIFGAHTPGAVRDDDLGFRTRRDAEEAPDRLRERSVQDRAADIVAAVECVPLPAAHQRIHDAARRAGISQDQLAEALIVLRLV